MPDAIKTVFLVVHQGFVARFLLRTDIFRTLKEAGVRIVIVTPNADEPYMKAEFAAPTVVLEPLRGDLLRAKKLERSSAWWLVTYIRNYALAHGHRSQGFQQKYRRSLARISKGQPFVGRCIHAAIQVLWRSRTLRRLLLALEMRLYTEDLHADLFESYRPNLVVTTGAGYADDDAMLLREARRHGVPTAAVILSWDHPTTKGYRGADPDHVVVWSDRMADQMVRFHDIPRERIFVGGVPYFDHYLREDGLLTREELCAQLELDPERRLVLFATSSPGLYRHNMLVAKTLARAIAEDALPQAQLVVRLHPINFRPDHKTPLDEWERLRSEYDHVELDVPKVLSDRLRIDMPASDSERLGSLMKHCDVLVNVFSTTTLEAFLLDRPVVLVASGAHIGDATQAETAGAEEPAPWDEYEHLQAVVEVGAARTARSMPELVRLVREYLDHPELDRQKRVEIARTECGPTDGYAGERIGRHLLGLMGAEEADWAPLEELPAPA
jgi:CDP-glycerol glycerophosphotransferase (TagB/SpsB family)